MPPSRLREGKPAEEFKVHALRETLVRGRERLQCFAQPFHRMLIVRTDLQIFGQLNDLEFMPAFLRFAAAKVIDDEPAHGSGGV